jgi:hypothetical protein
MISPSTGVEVRLLMGILMLKTDFCMVRLSLETLVVHE